MAELTLQEKLERIGLFGGSHREKIAAEYIREQIKDAYPNARVVKLNYLWCMEQFHRDFKGYALVDGGEAENINVWSPLHGDGEVEKNSAFYDEDCDDYPSFFKRRFGHPVDTGKLLIECKNLPGSRYAFELIIHVDDSRLVEVCDNLSKEIEAKSPESCPEISYNFNA